MIKRLVRKIRNDRLLRRSKNEKLAKYHEFGKTVKSFLATGEYPEGSLNQLITYYCESSGLSNDILHGIVSAERGEVKFSPTEGILNFSSAEKEAILKELNKDGFYVLPGLVEKNVCEGLRDIALKRECKLFPPLENGPVSAILDRENPLAAGYFLHSDITLNELLIQDLVTDHSILDIAQSYLGCVPTLNTVNLWWSLPSQDQRDISHLAQEFHFDMDRIKWLKIFVYVNDVDFSNGPHWFVRGSHRTGNQPDELLARGYARIPEADIRNHYSDDDIRCFTGEAGTVILEDTRGFHRGSPVLNGERLMFEIDFADCLFGAPAAGFHVKEPLSEKFVQCRERYPSIFDRISISEG